MATIKIAAIKLPIKKVKRFFRINLRKASINPTPLFKISSLSITQIKLDMVSITQLMIEKETN
ncbi:hypothetical protein CMA01_19820 [Carnobacterium maltaromaticum]|nr:hypothetical protein CMA01_19820 [Carnobacterium maltaromaticum]